MVSMQPTNQSYLPDEESCFLRPQVKPYRKGSLMNILTKHSPIFAYLCQLSRLDQMLDSDEFQGTVFAPCPEYCSKYWELFNSDTIDHQRARELVLASVLRAPMLLRDIFLEPDVDVPFPGCQMSTLPTLHRYTTLHAQVHPFTQQLQINRQLTVTKGDLQCVNGVLHLLSGMIEPDSSI